MIFKNKKLSLFIITPFEWLVYLLIMFMGLSRVFEKWANSRWKLIKNGAYLFLLYLFTTIIFYPIDLYRYNLSKEYGISTQEFSSWMKDFVIDFGLILGQHYWLY